MSAVLWSLPRRLALGLILGLGMTAGTLLYFAFGVLAPLIIETTDVTRTGIGALATLIYVAGGALTLTAGRVTDARDERTLLQVMFATSVVSFAVAGTFGGYIPLLIAALLSGAAVAFSNPVTNKLIAREVPAGQRGLVLGLKQSGVQMSSFFAGLLLPTAGLLFGWQAALLLCAGLIGAGLLAAAVFFRTAPEMPDLGAPAPLVARPRLRGSLRWLVAYSVLMGAGVGAVGLFLALYAHDELGMGVQAAGAAVMTMGFVGTISRITWGHIAERLTSPPRVLAALAGAAVLGQLLLWLAGAVGAWLVWPAAVLLGASASAWIVVVMVTIVGRMGVAVAGRASAMIQTAFYVGFVLTPMALGAVADSVGTFRPGWLVVLALFTLAGVTMVAWVVRGEDPEGYLAADRRTTTSG